MHVCGTNWPILLRLIQRKQDGGEHLHLHISGFLRRTPRLMDNTEATFAILFLPRGTRMVYPT